jgi:uncharacterized membrane protein YfcA
MLITETGFLALVAGVAVLAGAVASVSGFGTGSLLTPLLAVRVGTKLAVAAVAVPHLGATALRLWLMRKHVDRRLRGRHARRCRLLGHYHRQCPARDG